MATLEEIRRRRLKSFPALAPSSPLENSDSMTITDSGELAAPFLFSLIETQAEALILTDQADADNILVGSVSTAKTLMLAEIKLTGGTLFRAGKGVRHPTRFYVGKVKSFGSIIRSMAVPAGIPHIGDAVLQIIDTDQLLRRAAASNSIKNREVVMKIGSEGESENIFQIAYTGKISFATFDPGVARINLKDNTFQFFEEKLPDLLTRDNFVADVLFAKNLIARTEGRFDEREIFSPIVFGILDSSPLDIKGSLNAVRLDSTTFNLAQHPIPHSPIKIFVKDPAVGDTAFIEQIGGFSIIEVTKTIDEISYTFTHVVFGSARSDGFEVRWDGEGMTDDGTKDGTVVRNPADCIKLYLTRIAQQDETDQLDSNEFLAQAVLLDAVVTGGSTPGLFCDGAVTQRMTHREAISRLTSSFGIFIFTNKRGLISIRYIDSENLSRVVLDDVQDIYLKSEVHSLARPIFNQVDLQHTRTFSDQSWNAQLTVTDDLAVDELGRVESKDLKLFFVRDDFVGDKIARNFLQFVAPKSYRIMFTVPGHRRTRDIELGQLIGITNYSGIDETSGGYVDKEFLIHKTELSTDTKQLRVHAVARVDIPGFFIPTVAERCEGIISSDSTVNVYGAWLKLCANTIRRSTWMTCNVIHGDQLSTSWLEIDFAYVKTGAAAPVGSQAEPGGFITEQSSMVKISGVASSAAGVFSQYVDIPRGSDIYARCREIRVSAIRGASLVCNFYGIG